MQQNFWQRWSADYLHGLQQRQRWMRTSDSPQVGDIVLLKEDNLPPLLWPTAAITDTHPGKDHRVRVVTVKTCNGTFKCPVSKICPLPHVNSDD
jgi:hypothetical protein